MKQRCFRLDAHNIRHRNSDAKCAKDSLDHDKSCLTDTIVKSGIAEENSCKQAVDRICLEIICRCKNHFPIRGENSCQRISMEKRDQKHYHANGKRNGNAVMQGFSGSCNLTCAIVLCHKCRHGLHESRRYEHDKCTHFFCDTDTCRGNDSHRIYDCQNDQK